MSKREEELLDYSDTEDTVKDTGAASTTGESGDAAGAAAGSANGSSGSGDGDDAASTGASSGDGAALKGSYVGVHATSFKDFMLKPELLRAIVDNGFEHPSEVQQVCIPQSLHGMDVVCQAKSGLGKTAVFVLSTLQLLEPVEGEINTIVVCHTRELAYQIKNEYDRFSKYLPDVVTEVVYGGNPEKDDIKRLKERKPNVVVGTPGRLVSLVREKALNLRHLHAFVVDEADRVLESLKMRRDVQDVFRETPHTKQVMMFSATLSQEIRPVVKKFMQKPLELYVDDDAKLTLHGLQQYYLPTAEAEKNRKLSELLDQLEFNQVIIFVRSSKRSNELNRLLNESGFPSIAVNGTMKQDERIARYKEFKEFNKRICVATDVFGRGIDIERINLAINYDMPTEADQYLHRVGRAGRFGTKGVAVSFVSGEEDQKILDEIQGRFSVKIEEFPENGVDASTYMTV